MSHTVVSTIEKRKQALTLCTLNVHVRTVSRGVMLSDSDF